jgi:hypothetical protein
MVSDTNDRGKFDGDVMDERDKRQAVTADAAAQNEWDSLPVTYLHSAC